MSKLDTVFNQLKGDVTKDHVVSSCVYALNTLESLAFDRGLIHELWQKVIDEMSFSLLENNLDVYRRLNQFNSYLYFYLMSTLKYV